MSRTFARLLSTANMPEFSLPVPLHPAEIVLGTVTNIREAVQWLGYTYMYARMVKNPLVYGLTFAVRCESVDRGSMGGKECAGRELASREGAAAIWQLFERTARRFQYA